MRVHKNNEIDYVEFPSQSAGALAEVKKFYQDVFGWSFQAWGDTYADTKDSGIGCGINADAGLRTSSPLVVIYVHDLNSALDKVVSAGGKISRKTFSFPGGRRFHYKDPAGNELAVWSDK